MNDKITKQIDKLCEEYHIKTTDRIGRLELLLLALVEENKKLRQTLRNI